MEKTRYGMAHDRTGLAQADYYDVMLEEMREHSEYPGMFNKREVLGFKIRQAVHYILFLINADWEDCKIAPFRSLVPQFARATGWKRSLLTDEERERWKI